MHHWAHARRQNCDPWWENETQWHRDWKNLFPLTWREVSHVAVDGEIHRADVRTPSGLVIEFQHSSMTDVERISRESFYGNLVWIVDGRRFERNFDICHWLPHPESGTARDLVWVKARRHQWGTTQGIFFRMSEVLAEDPSITKATRIRAGGCPYDMREVDKQREQLYYGHHQYDWIRPHRTWLDAQCPVFIDFGKAWLVRLDIYDESGLPCIQVVAKSELLEELWMSTDAKAVSRRSLFLTRRL